MSAVASGKGRCPSSQGPGLTGSLRDAAALWSMFHCLLGEEGGGPAVVKNS